MRSLSGIRTVIAAAAVISVAATATAAWQPGLWGGFHTKGASDFTSAPIYTNVYLDTHCATNWNGGTVSTDSSDVIWSNNRVWTYWGQIYLPATNVTFGQAIDDKAILYVDGLKILNQVANNCVMTTVATNYTTAGWHDFMFQASNGAGGAGPMGSGNGLGGGIGFGVKFGTDTAWSYMTDDGTMLRYRYDDGLGFDDTFTISGVPARFGTPVPFYGVYPEVTNGSNLTMSVASGSGYVTASDTQRACCTGYVWYAVDTTTHTRSVVQSGAETSFAYSHNNMAEIAWHWKVEHLVSVMAGTGGSVSTNGGWGDHATDTLTITATPSAGYVFYQWTGDIDEAQRLNSTITVDFSTARSLTANFGGIYYLSPEGDDANDGLSWQQAFLTLSNAVVQATPGSTLYVTNGTYQVDSEITISKALAIVGVADVAQTIIKQKPAGVAQNNGTHLGFNMLKLDHADASLEGITLTGVVIDGTYSSRRGAVTITANGGTVRDCVFVNNRSVTYHTCGVGANLFGGLIDRCLFIGNTNSVGGVRGIVYQTGGTIQNCIFTDNQSSGGMICIETTTSDTVVRNCTLAANTTPASVTVSPGLYLMCANKSYYEKVRIENTISHGNIASGGTFSGFPNWSISNESFLEVATNSFYNCLLTGAPNGTCIDADPEFVNPANGDFTLLAASPCIDAGYANGLAYDYDGSARPSGAGIDIGAYEYDQSSLSAGFTADTLAAQAGTAFTLEATVRGPFDPGDLVYAWAITNTATGAGTDGSGASFNFSDPPAGFYTVVLTVTDNGQTPPAVATHAKEAYIVRSAAVMYVKPGNEAGEAFPYDTVANAAAKIPTAYALAIDGTTIRLEPGIHEITVQLIVEKGVTFIGDGSGAVIKQVTNGERVIYMDHADARFENVAITGGRKGSSSALGGPIPYARNQHGCGVRIGISGGTLYNCAVTNNSFTEYYVYGGGVGMLAGRVDRCLIADNTILTGSIPASGAGVHLEGSAVLENSVIVGNRTIGEGAVYVNSDNAVVRNCTIQGNQSSGSYSGGLYFLKGLAQNCAIYGNTSPAYNDVGPAAALDSPNIQYCATVDGYGANAVACGDPQFTDAAGRDFTFAAGSDLLDAGLGYTGAAALDFAGHARVSGAAIDIGAHEYDTSVAACGIAVAPTVEYLEGGSVTLTAVVTGVGDLTGLSYAWTLTDTYGVQTTAGASPVTLNLAAGTYDVALSVSGGSLETPLTELQPRLLHVVAPKIYGNPANAAGARYPWDTPATAAADLNLLVAEAIDGTEIHLAAGTYITTNVLDVTRGMRVVGDTGRDATFVTTSNKTHRLLWMSHADARVEGVTFTGCRSELSRYASGGVIHVTTLGGTLYDCRMTLCTNNVNNQNGQLYAGAGLVDRCLFDRNKAYNSSGVYNNNGIVALGGSAILRNSVIADNLCNNGGGLYFTSGATAENCTIIGNTATVQAGGVYTTQGGSRIRNCIIRGNTSPKSGSATDNADLYTNQSAANQLLMFVNVCTPLAIGTDCVTGDPLIKNPARGNYGIAPASPCRNAGAPDTWMADARDYAGNARLVDKIVDIGACETLPSGTMFLIR